MQEKNSRLSWKTWSVAETTRVLSLISNFIRNSPGIDNQITFAPFGKIRIVWGGGRHSLTRSLGTYSNANLYPG